MPIMIAAIINPTMHLVQTRTLIAIGLTFAVSAGFSFRGFSSSTAVVSSSVFILKRVYVTRVE